MTENDDRFTRQSILDIATLTPSLFSFRLSRDPGFRFRAGQFARLGLVTGEGEQVWRAYSIVSAPHDEFLDFFSIVIPDGAFTGALSSLQRGDELLLDKQANGFLTLDRFPDGEDLWLLASGTGIAPFLSILQDFEVWERFERIVLVYSVRHTAELGYQSLIHDLGLQDYLGEQAYKLTYLPVVTREQGLGLHQRIPELLRSGELEQESDLILDPARSRVMICGNPQMTEDVRAALKERGMRLALSRKPGQIAVENYW